MRLRAGQLLGTAALARAALGIAALWANGALAGLGWWIAAQQHAVQSLLAAEIDALRAGDTAALWGLATMCGAYGFLHALGPGHGKALIAGASVGLRASARRMALIALAGSLAQALVAIALVYAGFALFDVTARSLADGSQRWFSAGGDLIIALLGAWLLARGLAGLRRVPPDHTAHDDGRGCGHAHGPDPDEVARAVGPAATLALVAAMAARPCTGAIFVLVIAWRMSLPWAGALAVLAMGLGAAAFTALVAWLAVSSRDLLGAGSEATARLLVPGLQIAAGGLILAFGGLGFVGVLASRRLGRHDSRLTRAPRRYSSVRSRHSSGKSSTSSMRLR